MIRRPDRLILISSLSIALLLHGLIPSAAEAQGGWKKRLVQAAACGGGALAGAKLGEKVAEMEAKRLKLSPEEAAKRRRAFQIGLALALCGGGAAIAGTTFDRLSKRGREAREKELLMAVEEAQPRTYTDPERPSLTGTLTPQPMITEGDQECRVVEDYLADGGQGDRALVKYCRPAGGGNWALKSF